MPMLPGPEEPNALDAFDPNYDNCLTALERFHSTGAVAEELRLCSALGLFWQVRGYFTDGRKYLVRALMLSESAGYAIRAPALRWAGTLAREQGDLVNALGLLKGSQSCCQNLGDEAGNSIALSQIAKIHFQARKYAEARAIWTHILESPSGNVVTLKAEAEMGFGGCDIEEGNLSDSEKHLEASRRYFESCGAHRQEVQVLTNLVTLKAARGEYREACALAEKMLKIIERLNNAIGRMVCHNNLGYLYLRLGEFERSRGYYNFLLDDARMSGNRSIMSFACSGLADALVGARHIPEAFEQAKVSVRIAEAICDRHALGVGLCSLGYAQLAIDDKTEAAAIFSRSIDLLERVKNKADLERAKEGYRRALGSGDA
jgi:tetratricopeptide (TPR) repeat protein